ncbi:MAG TPA: PspC domain-containing protein [Allosphingosinicella sp.]|nr:PspC domain-containing protein [Allosphingosinicella sp.]
MARRKFQLDKRGGKLAGVCAGLANYFNIDVTFVRVGVVVATLLGGFPWTLIAYGVAAWAAKPKPALEYERSTIATLRGSDRDLDVRIRDIDRRMAEVEHYVTSSNNSLANEIESLR